MEPVFTEFRMNGCGNLIISTTPSWSCGGEMGFSMRFSGHFGGNMPKQEAVKLAKLILDSIEIQDTDSGDIQTRQIINEQSKNS